MRRGYTKLALLVLFYASLTYAQVGSTASTCIWNGSVADCLPSAGVLLRNQRDVRFGEATGNGSNYAAIQAPSSLAADYTLTLPVDDGTANQVLATDGSGVLSWASPTVTPTTAGNVYSNGSALQSIAFSGNGNKVFGVDSGGTTEEAKTLAVGTSGTDFAIANTTGTITFNLPSASASNRGAVTTAAQSFAGVKTFNDGVIFDDAASQSTLNFYRESSTSMTWSFANGTGGTPSGSVTARYTRIANWVNIFIPQYTAIAGSGNSILRSSTAIDSFARPATTTVNCMVFVIDNSVFQSVVGYLEIKADGILDLYRTGSGGPWTGSCGPSANFTCAYYVGTGS